jgi:hypothetical protein
VCLSGPNAALDRPAGEPAYELDKKDMAVTGNSHQERALLAVRGHGEEAVRPFGREDLLQGDFARFPPKRRRGRR